MSSNPPRRQARRSHQPPGAAQIETFGLDPTVVAYYAAREHRNLSAAELANIVRACAINALDAHDHGDDEEHAAALVRLQIIAAEMAWRLDPRAPHDPDYRNQIRTPFSERASA